jgi:uncharacterized Tic20 family protein
LQTIGLCGPKNEVKMTAEVMQNPSIPVPMSQSDERTWAMLAHLSVLVNLFTGVLGPVVALIIYLMFANRSKYVAYHAMQSFLFQLVVWYGIGVTWGIVGLLSAILIGVVLIPFACILTPILLLGMAIAPIYGIWGAIQTSQGQDFQYWWVGSWVRNILTGV